MTAGQSSPILRFTLTLLSAGAIGHLSIAAELADPQSAIDAGRRALRSGWNYPWYDQSSDSIARFDVKPPRPRSTWNRNWPNWDVSEALALLGWVLIAVLLAIVVYVLVRGYLGRETVRQPRVDPTTLESSAISIDRVEALPMAVDRSAVDFLAEARRLSEQGNLTAAIAYIFSYQLIELDRHQLLRLDKGKTNRQYLRELFRSEPAVSQGRLGELLSHTIHMFEAAVFGGQTPSTSAFQACWTRIEQFQSILAAQPAK